MQPEANAGKEMISRKEFFIQSAASLGKTLLEACAAVRPVGSQASAAESLLPLEPGAQMAAAAFNEHCLARSCGCFTCLERCEAEAIKLIPGAGIRINTALCTGCGICEACCPVTPKAVRLRPRPDIDAP
jgi:heterodisulfide reductase subunit A-like polyferredoxin